MKRVWVLCVMLLGLMGCGEGGITIYMSNFGQLPVHLWVDGFEEMGPDNKVEVKSSRQFFDESGDGTRIYKVHAGRDGQTLATVKCSQDVDTPSDFSVGYSEEGGVPAMVCSYDKEDDIFKN